MTIEERVKEAIEECKKIYTEHPKVSSIIIRIEDLLPDEIEEYTKKRERDLSFYDNTLNIFDTHWCDDIKRVVSLHFVSVKLRRITQTTYEII